MAHSLGNMVVSSMIQDHGLTVSKYLMCNSAVPAEAYDPDPSLRVPQLVHPDWEVYPTNTWAASYHSLFDGFPDDDRRRLGWPGRFSDVAQYAVNFYSTGDEVLELAEGNSLWLGTGTGTLDFGHMSWHKQELFKGRGIIDGLGGTDWSGWRFNGRWRSLHPAGREWEVRYTPEQAAGFSSIASNYRNFNLDDLDEDNGGVARPNDWPVRNEYEGQWLHSDMKDVAYFYDFLLYRKIVEKEGYYGSKKKISYISMGKEHEVKDGKWQPYGAKEVIQLRKIRDPVSLCKLGFGAGREIPRTNLWIGVDMAQGDFVKSHGKGERADFEVMVEWDGRPPVDSGYCAAFIRFTDRLTGGTVFRRCWKVNIRMFTMRTRITPTRYGRLRLLGEIKIAKVSCCLLETTPFLSRELDVWKMKTES